MVTPLSTTARSSLEEIQHRDGLYGVMLATLRNCEEKFSEKKPERIIELAHMCFLSAAREFLRDHGSKSQPTLDQSLKWR